MGAVFVVNGVSNLAATHKILTHVPIKCDSSAARQHAIKNMV